MAYKALATILFCAGLVACSESSNRSAAIIDPAPETNDGSLVTSPAPPSLSDDPGLQEPTDDPAPRDEFIDMSLSGIGVGVSGSISIDRNLNDSRRYYAAAYLQGELIRDSEVIELEGPSTSAQAIEATSISYQLTQRTYGVPIKASDVFRAKVTASIYVLESVEDNAPEELVYMTSSPFVEETPIQEFLDERVIPQVELNVDLTSTVLPVEAMLTSLGESSESYSSSFDFEIIQTSYYDNFLYLIARFPSSCPADDYILYIEKQSVEYETLSLESKLLSVQEEHSGCGVEATKALKFDLTSLRIHNERLFDAPFIPLNLGEFGTYLPASVPFSSRKVFADKVGCLESNDCEILLQFETDGRLIVESPVFSGTLAYIVSEEGQKIYSSASFTGVPSSLSEDGTTLAVAEFGGVVLVEQNFQ